MIPVEGAELPPGSDPDFLDDLRSFLNNVTLSEVGTVTSVLDGMIMGTKPWSGSPMIVVMEFFGMPFERDGYHLLIDNVRASSRLLGMDIFVSPTEPRRLAIVQGTIGTLESVTEFLRSRRS